MIHLQEDPNKFCYKVFWSNNAYLGKFIVDVDGFYYFYPKEENGGCWNEYSLRLIADKLDELNKEWREKIQNDPII